MARPEYAPGGVYHFYNRGAHRTSIFHGPDNYFFVLRRMKQYSQKFQLAVLAYCLMPNHYHFLIRQDGVPRAGLLPQRVFNCYSKAYNRRYGHSGTLFEGNYKVKPVKDQKHLANLCRYIHANPVLHGIVREVESWPYTNYLEWIGARKGTLVDYAFIADYFEDTATYQEYVAEYLENRRRLEELAYLDEEW